jgi:hypothetical protein
MAPDERVGDRPDRDDDGDGHATLPRRSISRGHRGVGRRVDVGIGEDDHVVLRAA